MCVTPQQTNSNTVLSNEQTSGSIILLHYTRGHSTYSMVEEYDRCLNGNSSPCCERVDNMRIFRTSSEELNVGGRHSWPSLEGAPNESFSALHADPCMLLFKVFHGRFMGLWWGRSVSSRSAKPCTTCVVGSTHFLLHKTMCISNSDDMPYQGKISCFN